MDALLKQFKEQYDNVFSADIKDQQFIFRELTRKEYKSIVDDPYLDDYALEETICKTAMLYPDNYDFSTRGRAGIAKALAAEITVVSGFAHPEQQVQMLDYYRQDMASFDSQAETIIQLVFPNVTEKEMQNWTQEHLMKYLARAEWVMREIWQMPFEFARRDSNENDKTEEVEPPSIEEIGTEIRAQGGDPMLVLKDQLIQKKDYNYVQFPLIGGTKLLGNEEVLGYVRQQIQAVSKRK